MSRNDKEQQKEYDRLYYQANQEKIRERKREYRKQNTDKVLAQGRACYQKNREKVLDRAREYRDKNKEKIAEQNKVWREKNKDYLKEEHRKWHLANKERVKEKRRARYVENPEKAKADNHRRRARMLGLESTLTPNEWRKILDDHFHRCHYCGAKSDDLHQDHKIPVADGGGYTAENIVPACQSCNQAKHTEKYGKFVEESTDRLQQELVL